MTDGGPGGGRGARADGSRAWPRQDVVEALGQLASTQSDRREAAYEALAAYTREAAATERLPWLLDQALSQLWEGLRRLDADAVFQRAFALLVVAEVLAADGVLPGLDAGATRRALGLLLRHARAERDVRGFVPGKGWAHAYAHAADALAAAACHPRLTTPDVRALARAVSHLVRHAPGPLRFDEDERLALAVTACARRMPLDPVFWRTWIGRLLQPFPSAPPMAVVAHAQAKAFARCLLLRLRWQGLGDIAAMLEERLRAVDAYGAAT